MPTTSKATLKEMPRLSSNGNAKSKVNVDYSVVKKAAGVLRAINHPLRQSMMRLLEEAGSMTVTELYNRLSLEQSVASQHLAILRKANVVKTTRDGKFIYYSVNEKRLADLGQLVSEIVAV